MSDEHLTIDTPDGPMDAFVAVPDGGGRGPALVVFQEAFGVNGHIRDVCRRLAAAGLVALAPELFHRSGRGVELGYDELAKVMPYLAGLDNDALARDATAALAELRAHRRVDPARVGTIGFCMGGFTSFLAACRTDVAATVAYYPGGLVRERPGIGLRPLVGEADRIRAPILLHFAGADAGIPESDVAAVRARLEEVRARFELHVHPGAAHGFHCDARASYHAEAAATAWARTLAWLGEHL